MGGEFWWFAGVLAFLGLGACGGGAVPGQGPKSSAGTSAPAAAAAEELQPTAEALDTVENAPEPLAASAVESEAPAPCPEDMVYIDTEHCPDQRFAKVGLKCLKRSYNKPNHLTICHKFAPGQSCPTAKRRQMFCIDRYEFPSRKGAHPPVMVNAYDAAAQCAAAGKRMCWESEWVAACEGAAKWPFPYGHERDKTQCNIDNRWIQPSLKKVYHRDPAVQDRELRRLDQSVASGSMESCRSAYGVYDLTGNFDEWVLTEYPRGKSKWAGLKGGAWGHVRNACRPITTSHTADFTYYFISFRCCKDPNPERARSSSADGPAVWQPPPPPRPRKPGGLGASEGWSPR